MCVHGAGGLSRSAPACRGACELGVSQAGHLARDATVCWSEAVAVMCQLGGGAWMKGGGGWELAVCPGGCQGIQQGPCPSQSSPVTPVTGM